MDFHGFSWIFIDSLTKHNKMGLQKPIRVWSQTQPRTSPGPDWIPRLCFSWKINPQVGQKWYFFLRFLGGRKSGPQKLHFLRDVSAKMHFFDPWKCIKKAVILDPLRQHWQSCDEAATKLRRNCGEAAAEAFPISEPPGATYLMKAWKDPKRSPRDLTSWAKAQRIPRSIFFCKALGDRTQGEEQRWLP